jgi:D-glycero-D-manno-heptose 1,7-bisphosphate phosphatase
VGTGAPAVFLDRDGVLVVPEFRDGRSFAPRDLANYAIYPDAPAAVAALKAAGFLTVVVTNQPDIGAGLIAAETVEEMHSRLKAAMPLDAICVCPHTRADKCDCRKPAPGLLIRAAEELGIDLARSYMVGDRASDVEAGKAAGCRTLFIDLGYTAEPHPRDADWTIGSLAAAAKLIQEFESRREFAHGTS